MGRDRRHVSVGRQLHDSVPAPGNGAGAQRDLRRERRLRLDRGGSTDGSTITGNGRSARRSPPPFRSTSQGPIRTGATIGAVSHGHGAGHLRRQHRSGYGVYGLAVGDRRRGRGEGLGGDGVHGHTTWPVRPRTGGREQQLRRRACTARAMAAVPGVYGQQRDRRWRVRVETSGHIGHSGVAGVNGAIGDGVYGYAAGDSSDYCRKWRARGGNRHLFRRPMTAVAVLLRFGWRGSRSFHGQRVCLRRPERRRCQELRDAPSHRRLQGNRLHRPGRPGVRDLFSGNDPTGRRLRRGRGARELPPGVVGQRAHRRRDTVRSARHDRLHEPLARQDRLPGLGGRGVRLHGQRNPRGLREQRSHSAQSEVYPPPGLRPHAGLAPGGDGAAPQGERDSQRRRDGQRRDGSPHGLGQTSELEHSAEPQRNR